MLWQRPVIICIRYTSYYHYKFWSDRKMLFRTTRRVLYETGSNLQPHNTVLSVTEVINTCCMYSATAFKITNLMHIFKVFLSMFVSSSYCLSYCTHILWYLFIVLYLLCQQTLYHPRSYANIKVEHYLALIKFFIIFQCPKYCYDEVHIAIL